MSGKRNVGRRGFLASAAGSAALAMTAGSQAHGAENRVIDTPEIRLGIVGCGPYSHGSYVSFITNRMGGRVRGSQMKITHVWGDDYRRNYAGSRAAKMDDAGFRPGQRVAEEAGAELVQRPNDMIGKVDAVMVMDFDRSADLAVPFLKARIPTFVNRPFAATMADGRAIVSAAEASGTALFTGSLVPWMVETRKLKSRIKRDSLVSFQADALSATYGQYVSHGIEFIYGVVGGQLRRARLTGWDASSGFDPAVLPPLLVELEYEPVGDTPPCRGTMYASTYKFPHYWWFRGCHADGAVVEGDIINHEGLSRTDVEYEWYVPFLARVEQVFRTNTSPETGADILHKLGTLLAAHKSAMNGGAWAGMDEIENHRLSSTIIASWDERI